LDQTLDDLLLVEYLQLSLYREAEDSAKEIKVGLWQDNTSIKPRNFRSLQKHQLD